MVYQFPVFPCNPPPHSSTSFDRVQCSLSPPPPTLPHPHEISFCLFNLYFYVFVTKIHRPLTTTTTNHENRENRKRREEIICGVLFVRSTFVGRVARRILNVSPRTARASSYYSIMPPCIFYVVFFCLCVLFCGM